MDRKKKGHSSMKEVSHSTISLSSISTASSEGDPGDLSYTDLRDSKEDNSRTKKSAESTKRESRNIGCNVTYAVTTRNPGSPFSELFNQVCEAINSGNAFSYITEQRMCALRKLTKNFAKFAAQSGNQLMEGLFFVGFWILAMFFMVCLHLFTTVYDMFSRRREAPSLRIPRRFTPSQIPKRSASTQIPKRSQSTLIPQRSPFTHASRRCSPTNKSSAKKSMLQNSILFSLCGPSRGRSQSTSSHRRKQSTSLSTSSHRRKQSTSPSTSSQRRKQSTSRSISSQRRRESRSPGRAPKIVSSTKIDVTAIRMSPSKRRAASCPKPQSQSISRIVCCPSRIPKAKPCAQRSVKKPTICGGKTSKESGKVYVQRHYLLKKATVTCLPQLIKQKQEKSALKCGSKRSARKYPISTTSAAKRQEKQAQARAQKDHVGHTHVMGKSGSGSTLVISLGSLGSQCGIASLADTCSSTM